MSDVTPPVTRYSERNQERVVTDYTYTYTDTVSQSALRPTENQARLPIDLVEKARAAAQRNLEAEPVEADTGQAAPPPPPPRRLTDRPFSEDDLDLLVSHRVAEATAAGFPPQYPSAYRAAVRARELQREAETPGWIRQTAQGLRRRSGGLR